MYDNQVNKQRRLCMKKLKLIFMINLLIILLMVNSLVGRDIKGELYDINGKTVLKIWGTHAERGYAYGYLQSNQMLEVLKNYIITNVFFNNAIAYENARNYFVANFSLEQKYYDETENMINGIEDSGAGLYSDVLGRNLDHIDILLSNSILDISAVFTNMNDFMHCSSLSSWGESTNTDAELNGESIITRLLDWTPAQPLLDNQLIIISLPAEADEQNWVSFSFAGLIGALSGINEEGVSAFMNVGNNNNHPNTESYHPILLSIRNGIEKMDYNGSGECNSEDVAAAISDKFQLSASIVHSLCSTTQDSFALVVECNNEKGVAIRTNNDNTMIAGDNLAATNHFRKLYSPVYCSRYQNISDSLNTSTNISSNRSWDLLCGAAGTYGNMQALQYIPFNGKILWATSPNSSNPAYTQNPSQFDLQNLFDLQSIDQNNTSNKLMLSCGPNPCFGDVTIKYKLPNNLPESKINVFNILGQLIKQIEINNDTKSNEIKLDMGEFSTGIYFISFNLENSPIKKIVLMR